MYKTTTEANTVKIPSKTYLHRGSTYFSKFPEEVSTILLQQTSAGGYAPLRYLVWEDILSNTWNTAEPNLSDPKNETP